MIRVQTSKIIYADEDWTKVTSLFILNNLNCVIHNSVLYYDDQETD